MRPRRLIVFLVIALALGAYYGFVEVPRKAREERLLQTADALATFDPGRVEHVHITRAGTHIEFALVDTHWEMTSPFADLADQSAVGRLIASVALARVERRLLPGDDLSGFGLSEPLARVGFLSARSDTLFAFALGANTIDNGFAYAMTNDDAVLLIPTSVRRYALAEIEDFRNKLPLIFDISQVLSFTIISERSDVRWFRNHSDGWATVVAGDTIRGDTRSVEALLRRLRGLRARAFLPAGAIDFSGAPSVMLTTLDNAVLHLRIAATEHGVFSQLEGETRIVEVDSSALNVFVPEVADLRDRVVLRIPPERVARITLTARDTTATIVRAGDGWGSPNPATGMFSPGRFTRVWRHLDGLRYATILRREDAPSASALGGDPIFSLAVYARGDTILDAMWYRSAPATTGLAPATSRSSRVVGTIKQNDIDTLVRLVRELRSP